MWLAHRLAWFLTYGTLPALLRHVKCGNPSCVNLAHLEPGTQAQNMADMVRMGRSLVGVDNPAAKLTEERVRSIFARIQAGEKQATIAHDEGVSQVAISQIATGLMWTHVTGVARRIPKRNRRRPSLPAPSPGGAA